MELVCDGYDNSGSVYALHGAGEFTGQHIAAARGQRPEHTDAGHIGRRARGHARAWHDWSIRRVLHQRYEREVTTLLEDAVRRSDLPSATDVPAAATLFFCAIQGLAFQFAIARYRRTRVWDSATRLFALYVSAIGARQTALDGSMDRRSPGARATAPGRSAPGRQPNLKG